MSATCAACGPIDAADATPEHLETPEHAAAVRRRAEERLQWASVRPWPPDRLLRGDTP